MKQTARFDIVRRIGEGGMGVVYHAREKTSGRDVALKTLRDVDAQGIYRLKQEFRSLSDLEHDNLIRLGELFTEQGKWFFTMELLDGVGFLEHVADDEERLRASLAQLVSGVAALHDAGRVHRDVKPTNIMVTKEGRVVLLDFGLATELDVDTAEVDMSDENVVGTVAYMAPEQATGMPPGPEADWYSVGVILFEALTGELPFSGAAIEIMMDKQRLDPKRPRDLRPSVAEDLDQLCVELLSFDPRARPDAQSIIARLGVTPTEPTSPTSSSTSGRRPFVGREREMVLLLQAFNDSRAGRAIAVLVTGESGIGKTMLVRRFIESLYDKAQVFRGRCYQRESLPFKAFDALVDSISRYLNRLDQVDVALLLPKQIALLAQVFPVLRRVQAVARARLSKEAAVASVHERRALAFAALADLLSAIAEREPVVLFIDDLQWADADSLRLLNDLLGGERVPPILLVGSVRTEQGQASRVLEKEALATEVRELELERLAPEQAALLVSQLSGESGEAASVAADAAGHPLFIHELVRHRVATGRGGPLSLDEAIWSRVSGLEQPARRLLIAVAVAGAPIALSVASEVAGLSAQQIERRLGVLRIAHLVRTFGPRDALNVEPYHNRVRDAVLAKISDAERSDTHRKIADAIEASPAELRDPRMLVRHLIASGEKQRAAEQAVDAAQLMVDAMAFDQAAELYGTALSLSDAEGRGRYATYREMAFSLRNAGRGREAAAAFLAAAEHADSEHDRIACRRDGAQQLLLTGQLDEGLHALDALLGEIGEKLVTSRFRAIASLVWRRFTLWILGYRYTVRQDADPRLTMRFELYRTIARGLAFVDGLRGAYYQTRALALALRSGDRRCIAWALIYDFSFLIMLGFQKRAELVLEEARRAAAGVEDDDLKGMLEGMPGFTQYFSGDFKSAANTLAELDGVFRDLKVTTARSEMHNGRLFRLFALRHVGAFRELKRAFDHYLRDATARGDHYMQTSLLRSLGIRWLLAGEPERARAGLDKASWQPPEGGFHVQHWYEIQGRAELALYEGRGAALRDEIAALIDAFESSQLIRVKMIRLAYWWIFGRIALTERSLKDADRFARALMRVRDGGAFTGWGYLIAACTAHLRGDREAAVGLLAQAAATFEEHGWRLYHAVAQRRQGQLVGGDSGGAMIEAADAFFASEDYVAVPLIMAMFTPGFDEDE